MDSEWTCISYCKWGYSSHVRKYQRVLSLKLTIAPENRPYPKGKGSSPNPHFSGATLVSGSVIIFQHVSWTPQQSWVSLPTWWRKSQTFPTEICRRVRSSAAILMKLCLICPKGKVFQTSHQHLKSNSHIIPGGHNHWQGGHPQSLHRRVQQQARATPRGATCSLTKWSSPLIRQTEVLAV